MLTIPRFMDKDDYLQNPIMHRFSSEHNLDVVNNRADFIRIIENFANSSPENEEETRKWLLQVAREGSKDFTYKKVFDIPAECKDATLLDLKLKSLFPDCPMENVLTYVNTYERKLINYEIITNENDKVEKIAFTFSQKFLTGDNSTSVEDIVFPVFVDVYVNEGFVFSRAKAKSTLYAFTESKLLSSDNHVDSLDNAFSAVYEIIRALGLKTETETKKVKASNSQLLYRMYQEFSFTPEEVENKVDSVKEVSNAFIDTIFTELGLKAVNKETAIKDLAIFVEKFISINGNNENIFKEDRPAYLIKVGADDAQELTKIDTSSSKKKPLQCTEAFFDSKKSVLNSKACNKVHLCFKRTEPKYFGKNPICVQFATKKNYGTFKTAQYAEEADINNVIQTIFRNY